MVARAEAVTFFWASPACGENPRFEGSNMMGFSGGLLPTSLKHQIFEWIKIRIILAQPSAYAETPESCWVVADTPMSIIEHPLFVSVAGMV